MEPKKARIAIASVVIVALLIIAVCLCMLLEFNPFKAKPAEPADNQTNVTVITTKPEAPTPTPSPTPVPGPSDLKGCSEELYKPKAENYLPAYVEMITYSETEGKVSLQYRPEKKQYSRDVIMELDHMSPVLAIAQENGYTLVLVQEGVAGWIVSYELNNYN